MALAAFNYHDNALVLKSFAYTAPGLLYPDIATLMSLKATCHYIWLRKCLGLNDQDVIGSWACSFLEYQNHIDSMKNKSL
jgi:hypothetical protein